MKLAIAILLCGAAACGGDDGNTTITLTPQADMLTPDVLAYREAGDTAWTELPAGTLAFSVSGRDYEVALACTDSIPDLPGVRHYNFHYLRTVDDPHTIALGCYNEGAAPPPQTHLTGTMVQAGSISVSGDDGAANNSGDEANWAIDLTAPTTSTTLVAVDDAFTHALARRDLDASATETDLGTIDVDAQGTALATKTLTIAGVAATETITADMTWSFGTSGLIFGPSNDDGTQLAVLPDDMLVTGDVQDWYVTAAGPTDAGATVQTSRGVEIDYRSTSPTSYALLDPIAGAAFTGSKVTWTSLPAVDDLVFNQLSFDGTDAGRVSTTVLATARASADAGAMSLDTDVSDFPHFVPAWTPSPGANFLTSFYADHDLDAGHYNVSWVGAQPVDASATGASRSRRSPRVNREQLVGARAQ